jgi:hypothetical protein
VIIVAAMPAPAGWLFSPILADLNSFHFFERLLFMALNELPKFCFCCVYPLGTPKFFWTNGVEDFGSGIVCRELLGYVSCVFCC